MIVLVTGASGTLGTALVPALRDAGHEVRPMSRRARPGWVAADLATGEGVAEAVRGADAIVHLASSQSQTQKTDVDGTGKLVASARAAGVRHLLYVSIIGIDRVPLAYYRRKLAAEEAIRAGGVPFTLLRASQFPQFLETLVTTSARLGPLIFDPRYRVQPVAVEDVAARIVDLLAGPPLDGITEFAGPETLDGAEVARTWLRARGSRRPFWPVHMPGRLAEAVRGGGLTTTATPTGTRTWRDYLAAKY